MSIIGSIGCVVKPIAGLTLPDHLIRPAPASSRAVQSPPKAVAPQRAIVSFEMTNALMGTTYYKIPQILGKSSTNEFFCYFFIDKDLNHVFGGVAGENGLAVWRPGGPPSRLAAVCAVSFVLTRGYVLYLIKNIPTALSTALIIDHRGDSLVSLAVDFFEILRKFFC